MVPFGDSRLLPILWSLLRHRPRASFARLVQVRDPQVSHVQRNLDTMERMFRHMWIRLSHKKPVCPERVNLFELEAQVPS